MRAESGFAPEEPRRSTDKLLHGESLKVVNMLELARELSGTVEQTKPPRPIGVTPAEFWKRKL
ncbi:MAG TPA: hypothetical protein VK530_09025, partial [Candidatus Acidoferrum sp.]|nr:hypothetical protein [Candidatus Acidoferrum sp.]